jgi:hypothetical protein
VEELAAHNSLVQNFFELQTLPDPQAIIPTGFNFVALERLWGHSSTAIGRKAGGCSSSFDGAIAIASSGKTAA